MALFHSVLWLSSIPFGEGSGTPLQHSCLENPMDGRAWWAAVHGVAKSRTRLSDFTFTFMKWRRKWQPTPVFLPGESQGWGSLVGCVYGVAQSQTRLKRLSSSSSSSPCIYVPHLYSFTYKNPIVKCCHILRYWEMHFNK